ncbi:M56 family metallopeptidase [Lutispora saccharofermentans]|uniref:M56 family metallopeptidase n=1 Tax=Lutispora saccharofermentans TaxID=3024236 RepID=A0ABT1NLB7_9FIRM|nr:M56 family metallopeptidase [Lutispora saccharofermentans]MCQ1530701.1 M56 family metallopeptidase [Lutispora saccharofermentans]
MWTYTLLPQILNMSLTAGIVIVLVLLARLMLRRVPKIFSYALWAVVLFRLVCPVSFSSEFSLIGLFNTPAPAAGNGAYSSISYIPTDIVHTESPQVDLPLPGVSKVINDSLPQGREQTVADPLEFLMSAATMLWLLGIAAMLIYSVVSLIRLRRKLVGAVCMRDNICLADHISTPFVIGVLRPKIYLPSTLSEQEQSYIILHEQTHIRRLDHIVKMIAFLALAVHWFNPLVWVAFVCCVKDMEMSCDERVLKQMGGEIKGAYSTSLLSLATGRRLINGSPLAFGEGNIKGRIKNVMNFKKPDAWVTAVSIVLVAALSVGFAANKTNGKVLTAQAALDAFSAEYKGSKVSFVIPENYDKPENWNILIASRHIHEDGFSQSAHHLEEINDAKNWEPGKRYTLDITEDFTELNITVSLPDENGKTLIRDFHFDFSQDSSADEYFKALEAAQQSVKTENIIADNLGDNEKTAQAWMDAWFAMFKVLPENNMARITDGVIDSLEIKKVSKEGLPKAFVFSVEFSVRPTYPIARNAFWMAGNTGNSPGRDETWGQMYREVELRLEDDGRYHFVEMGTGGVGSSGEYNSIAYLTTEDDGMTWQWKENTLN